MNIRLSKSAARAAGLSRTALAAALLMALAAHAQDQGSAETGEANKEKKVTELNAIVVTGTRKAGLSPTESISPIDVYSGAQIEEQATGDMTDSLTKIMPALNTQRFPIADGTAFVRPVSLRNLSPDQTLILVDGVRRHRSALVNLQYDPLGTVNQGAQAVDFSAIPANAVKRVEVLRDGASVLYGSDAIAGVVNVILNDAPQGAAVSAQYGEYSKGDGARLRVDADAGFALGPGGFLHVSAERDTSDITSRGTPRPDAAAVAAIVGADQVPYHGFGQRWGDPDITANKLFLNAGIHVNDGIELYGFGSYMENETLGGFFYRGPVLPAQYGIDGRATLISDSNPHDFLPDNASQSLVDSIIAGGGNPANYLTADPNSPSGWVLLNPIYKKFPGGYSPLFGGDITDHEFVGGARGELGSVKWDFHGRTAGNDLDYRLENSINPSLGDLSPTSFHPGKLTQEEKELGADFTQSFGNNPLTLAYGAQWRNETYKIRAGDAGSTAVGPTAGVFGVGSDGFQGFFPASAGKFEQDSYSAYADAETSFGDKLSGAAAVRYEHADRYGSKTVFKLSGRYQFTDTFAARATYNTGFRTPTPGQEFTLNVTTTADSSGNLIPAGTYPVSNPVALALGAVPLETEKSKNLSLGAVWDPLDNVSVTVDYYKIKIDNRIGLINKKVTQATVDTLTAENYPNAQLLLNSAASYFGNAFGSDVDGLDFVIDTRHHIGDGTLNIDLRYNYNKQDVVDVKPGTINASRVYDLENQVPKNRATLSFDYAWNRFDGIARVNYYGGWSTTGGLFSPDGNSTADAHSYGSNALLDLEVRYKINDILSIAAGGDNVFNTYPDKEANGTLAYLGSQYAVTSPFGIDGAFWYVRAKAEF